MRSVLLAMAIGIGAVAWFPHLPEPIWLAALPAGWLLGWRWRRRPVSRAGLALILGLCWGVGYGYGIRAGLLPVELEQQELMLSGRVISLVEQGERFGRPMRRFQLQVERCRTLADEPCGELARVQLNWYEPVTLAGGERWRLRVKLRRPHGFANPGGFDQEAWLVAQRIGAVGHVVRSADNRLLAPPSPLRVASWRGRLHAHLDQRLQDAAQRPLLLALLVGDGSAIDTTQWATFRATGTVHLFVVSGLHIALTGGALLWLGRCGWRSPWCRSRRSAYLLGALPALIGAAAYALLAGFGLPIQRALVMFAVAVAALVSWREVRAADALVVALWLVLMGDPLAVQSAGFWFSFIAVGAILLALGSAARWRWWRVQWAVFVASLPVLLVIAGEFSLLALPANLVAIPWTTLATLPLAFAGLAVEPVWPTLASMLWRAADFTLQWLCFYLEWLQGFAAGGVWRPAQVGPAGIICAAVAAGLLLLPRGMPGRALWPVLLLPLLWPAATTVPVGVARVTVIDVGQGLSVLVETHRHRLLYDTGPAFASGSTAAELAVRPLLRSRGIAALDALVVSHRDDDHAGGWRVLQPLLRGPRLLVGEALGAPGESACRAGQGWRWDGVDFRIVHPSAAMAGNDGSCVLQIDAGGARALLTGDIGRRIEARLAGELPAVVLLVAPHHGSRSSSSVALISATQPRYVVFSAGYRNQFRHPHPEVVARYRAHGAALFNTADSGALTFTLQGETVTDIAEHRARWRRYWQRRRRWLRPPGRCAKVARALGPSQR